MSGWWWLALAAVLGLTELVAPGVYLVFFAAAAGLTGLLLLATGDAPLWMQLLCFGLSSVAAVLLGRRVYRERPVPTADPLLNDRAARLVGELVTVAEPIAEGRGRVTVGDSVWPARGPDLALGARARVAAIDGGVLLVEPVDA